MNCRFYLLIFSLVGCCGFAAQTLAAVVFKPGEKAKFVAPGEEEISGNARELFDVAQTAEKNGNRGRAIKAYRALVRRYPKDALAGGSAYRLAELYEQSRDYSRASTAYANLLEKYPQSPRFNESIEALFRIGDMYLNTGKTRLFGVPVGSTYDRAIEVFASVVRLAPFGKYTARAQFDIGLAREKQGLNDLAVAAFQGVIDKFPDSSLAADAQYQIGYLWFTAARQGTKDPNAAEQAKVAFQDFLYRYPKSEKVPQARENLRLLEHKQTADSFGVAKFYDKQRNYRAAVIYYNDVIRQQPGSPEGDAAKKRIDQLRAKVGDAALQPRSITEATARKKPAGVTHTAESETSSVPAMRTSPNDVAPLPPPESDVSLPPPASLDPDTTTAPALSPTPTATPEASASPAP